MIKNYKILHNFLGAGAATLLLQNRGFTTQTLGNATVKNNILDPYFVTGFSDAEGCFNISVSINAELKCRVKARFMICLHSEDAPILLAIKEYFGVGNITKDLERNMTFYIVSKLEDLYNIIIPHFKSYPLLSKKHIDYILFCKVVNIMVNKGHLTKEGLEEIISIRASINKGLSVKLTNAFATVKPIVRPDMGRIITTLPSPQWLVGFTAGDGSFSASRYRTKSIRARFSITQDSRDLELLEVIKNYLGVGSIYKNGSTFNYEVGSIKDCLNYIIPFFSAEKNTIPPITKKAYNFKIWKEIVEKTCLMTEKDPTIRLQIESLLSKLNVYDKKK